MTLKEVLTESLEVVLKNYDKLGEIGILDLSLSNTITDDDTYTKISKINIEIVPMQNESFSIEETSIKEQIYDEFDKLQSSKSEELEC
jgi:hypothetical protein